ncbi:MAG TPA: hypothetical protein VHV27_08215 [Phenylobacterium sp.]|nr:hypothetical protein [Phenylobacterium sp.]
MRTIAAFATLTSLTALAAPAAVAAPAPSPAPSARQAALAAGDWRRAAELGASAADVVRGLQAKGGFAEMVPAESVVTIGPDNRVEVVALKPLPSLDAADTAGKAVRTTGLGGSGFAFTARWGSIILYPAYARSFASR